MKFMLVNLHLITEVQIREINECHRCRSSYYVSTYTYIPLVHKSLQNYNGFVWTVTRLNGDMNYSLRRLGYR